MEKTPSSHHKPGRKSRAKANIGWDKAVMESNGVYKETLQRIAIRFPMLSVMELKVAVLLRDIPESWKIGEIIGITGHSVENHRSQIHKKLSLGHLVNLSSFFAQF